MKTLKIYSITIKTRLNSVFANKGKILYITYQSAYSQKEAREKAWSEYHAEVYEARFYDWKDVAFDIERMD